MDNQLQIIVDESGLEKSKAQIILDKFTDYFEVAAKWEKEAKELVVTDASQTEIIEKAAVGRKILSGKRIELEKTRKLMKENSLREGQAIDGISKTLKALIIPLEDYLKQQECFVQIAKAKKDEEILRLAHAKEEEDRLAREKAEMVEAARLFEIERKEQERVRRENEKLKKEIEEKDRLASAERKMALLHQKKIEEARRKEQEKARKEKEALEEKARTVAAKAREEREKAEEEKRIVREKADASLRESKRLAGIEKKKHEDELAKLKAVVEEKPCKSIQATCPNCGNVFTQPI